MSGVRLFDTCHLGEITWDVNALHAVLVHVQALRDERAIHVVAVHRFQSDSSLGSGTQSLTCAETFRVKQWPHTRLMRLSPIAAQTTLSNKSV